MKFRTLNNSFGNLGSQAVSNVIANTETDLISQKELLKCSCAHELFMCGSVTLSRKIEALEKLGLLSYNSAFKIELDLSEDHCEKI